METPFLRDLLNSSNNGKGNGTHRKPQTRYALAYLRVSKDNQEEKSQRKDIEEWAQENNAVILDWFADHAARANDDEAREYFWLMVERAKSDPRISLVLVWDSYRFYRDRLRAAALKYDLKKHGVEAICVTSQHDPDSDISPLMDALHEAFAEQESRKNRARTLNRQRDNCETRDPETGWRYKNGGLPPFGMKQVRVKRGWNKERDMPIFKQLWDLDDTIEAGRPRYEWVRTILLDWLTEKGWGYKRILNELNGLGVKPVRNQYWSKSSIRDLLRDDNLITYCGHYAWNKHSDKWLGADKKREKRDTSEWHFVENAHPAIPTEEEASAFGRRGGNADTVRTLPPTAAQTARMRFQVDSYAVRCAAQGGRDAKTEHVTITFAAHGHTVTAQGAVRSGGYRAT